MDLIWQMSIMPLPLRGLLSVNIWHHTDGRLTLSSEGQCRPRPRSMTVLWQACTINLQKINKTPLRLCGLRNIAKATNEYGKENQGELSCHSENG